jgi:hypothetical protein
MAAKSKRQDEDIFGATDDGVHGRNITVIRDNPEELTQTRRQCVVLS